MKQLVRATLACLLWLPVGALGQEATEPESKPLSNTETATQTDWQICNETSFILRLAVARREAETSHISGWQRLRPSECISHTLKPNSPRFLFAESDPVHNGGIREWAGQVPICVNPAEDFDINTTVSCALQGLETRRFLSIDPTETVTKLIEPDDFSDKAETAGLQRLMQDAGYKITRVDGITGRRTRNTLRQFLKDYDIDEDLPVFEQMDALVDATLSKRDLTGLMICNQTPLKSWISIGYREDGSWQSRGWWGVEPQNCIRPWSKDLIGTEMHIYAQQGGPESDLQVLKNPIETINNFCVAEAKFSALGREYCSDQGYVTADFRPVPTEEKGLKITLSPEDFITPSSGGLR